VRCMDLNPFLPMGIDERTAHFLDTFLLYCLMQDSPPDTPEEIAELSRNQHATASRGREPGLRLERQGQTVLLMDWAQEILKACEPVARVLDEQQGGTQHQRAWENAWAQLADPDRLPSSRVLAAMNEQGGSHHHFTLQRSLLARANALEGAWSPDQEAAFASEAQASLGEQARVEAADTLPFEQYRLAYLDVARLGLPGTLPCANEASSRSS
jgi:glutamate--cysteine ligase